MSIWKELLGQLVRKFLIFVFGMLVSHAILPKDLAEHVTDSATGIIVTFLLLVLPLGWSVLKVRFNVWYARFALKAAPGTPVQEIKRDVLANIKGVSPV